MRFSDVSIEAYGYELPTSVLTTSQLEERLAALYEALRVPSGRLAQLTGVNERRLWPVGTLPSTVAAAAAEKIFASGQCQRSEIDLVIHAGVCRDGLEPSTASVVHHTLGLDPHCMVFDLSNACLGFLNAMVVAAGMIESGLVKKALIVTGENAAPIYEDTIVELIANPNEHLFRKRIVNLTLGSGALAMVLSKKSLSPSNHRLLGGVGQAYTKAHPHCRGYGDNYHQMMETDTAALMADGLMLSKINWELFKRELEWGAETPSHIFTHQVSRSHQEKVFETLSLDITKGRTLLDVYGNTGSLAAPLSLVLSAEDGRLNEDQQIALLGIGSGLHTMMLGIQW